MSLFAVLFGRLLAHRATTPAVLGSRRSVPEGRRSMRVPGRSCFSLAARAGGFLSGAQPASGALFRPALPATPFRLASAPAQRLAAPAALRVARAASRHSRRFSAAPVSRLALQSYAEKTAPSSTARANPALNQTPVNRPRFQFPLAARRRLAPRWASQTASRYSAQGIDEVGL